MRTGNIRNVSLWLALLLFMLACAVPALAPSPTPIVTGQLPETLDVIIEQTAAAAQTQTTTALPSPTFTLTPTRTPTITPTATPTFFFSLYTQTPIPIPTEAYLTPLVESGGSSGGSTTGALGTIKYTGQEWTCAIVGRSQPNGAVVKAGISFYVYITFVNTGTKTWPSQGVDFVYRSGYRQVGGPIMDIPKTVPPGNSLKVGAMFEAPKREGIYNSIWTLKVGNNPFCGVKISFKVN